MKRKSIHITEIVHEKIDSLAFKYRMPKSQLVNTFLELCIREGINPTKPVTNQYIKDLFISFTRTQEKAFFIPANAHDKRMSYDMDKVLHNVLAIKANLKNLEYQIEHLKK